jgi:transcriptional regulator with XRE-family HTH domain|tara:strand:- start:1954 stop:2358 length:405 start_codon:yes stop_codon:yes gene_type:complete
MAGRPGKRRFSQEVEIDKHIGKRLREARALAKLTLVQLGEGVGTSYQQIQSYECGDNRIAVSRLWSISQFLSLPIGYFYEGLENAITSSNRTSEILEDPSNLKFLGDYSKIQDSEVKSKIRLLVAKLSDQTLDI